MPSLLPSRNSFIFFHTQTLITQLAARAKATTTTTVNLNAQILQSLTGPQYTWEQPDLGQHTPPLRAPASLYVNQRRELVASPLFQILNFQSKIKVPPTAILNSMEKTDIQRVCIQRTLRALQAGAKAVALTWCWRAGFVKSGPGKAGTKDALKFPTNSSLVQGSQRNSNTTTRCRSYKKVDQDSVALLSMNTWIIMSKKSNSLVTVVFPF